jgi:hypothetical protein
MGCASSKPNSPAAPGELGFEKAQDGEGPGQRDAGQDDGEDQHAARGADIFPERLADPTLSTAMAAADGPVTRTNKRPAAAEGRRDHYKRAAIQRPKACLQTRNKSPPLFQPQAHPPWVLGRPT